MSKGNETKKREDKETRGLVFTGNLGETLGTSTGGATHTTVAGGWAGTDDETSDAPSDGGDPRLVEDDDRVPQRVIDTTYEQFERKEEDNREIRLEREDLEDLEERFEEDQERRSPGERNVPH